MISTRDLRPLPDVIRLRMAFQSMAMMDAIIMPEWEFREEYYQPRKFRSVAVRGVFEYQPLTELLVHELNPDRSLIELSEEIRQIGYGCSI